MFLGGEGVKTEFGLSTIAFNFLCVPDCVRKIASAGHKQCSADAIGLEPTRTRIRARPPFFVFAFTASPLDDKSLINRDLRVKASPHSPSPVKC